MDINPSGTAAVAAFVMSPYQSNCYVIAEVDEPGARAIIVDPGDTSLAPVFAHVAARAYRVEAVWATHGHVDHVLGVDVVRDRYSVPALVHRADLVMWRRAHTIAADMFGQRSDALRNPDGFFADGDVVRLGELSFDVWHTPGHSPGSVCFVGRDFALTGDTLFAGSIGRTDLPLSDPQAMTTSLRHLLQWSDDLKLYPGHNQQTTMAVERSTNPFLARLV